MRDRMLKREEIGCPLSPAERAILHPTQAEVRFGDRVLRQATPYDAERLAREETQLSREERRFAQHGAPRAKRAWERRR